MASSAPAMFEVNKHVPAFVISIHFIAYFKIALIVLPLFIFLNLPFR